MDITSAIIWMRFDEIGRCVYFYFFLKLQRDTEVTFLNIARQCNREEFYLTVLFLSKVNVKNIHLVFYYIVMLLRWFIQYLLKKDYSILLFVCVPSRLETRVCYHTNRHYSAMCVTKGYRCIPCARSARDKSEHRSYSW